MSQNSLKRITGLPLKQLLSTYFQNNSLTDKTLVLLLPSAYPLCYSARYNMTEETTLLDADLDVAIPVDEAPAEPRIYELGYHIIPTVKEEDVEKIVGSIRSVIEKAGGSFIAEGAPSLTKLSYAMNALAKEGEK